MNVRFLLLPLMLVILYIATASIATAQRSLGRETLRGLRGVKVSIDNFVPEAEKEGLSKSQLQVDVELRLRKAGIRVLTEEEWLKTPGMPALYVLVTTHENKIGVHAFSIRVKLRQEVKLVRQPNFRTVLAGTYETNGYVGTVGSSNLRNLREAVADEVDVFINDYLAENPKGN